MERRDRPVKAAPGASANGSPPGCHLRIASIGKRYADKIVLDDVSFELFPGEFAAVLGPSGCGKTTLINIIAGFVDADTGCVEVDGKVVRDPGVDRTVVFQDLALFLWKNALDNVAFGLRATGMKRVDASRVAQTYLELVRLGHAADLFPVQMSGGMRQRLALARALAPKPRCLLLDEPLSSLDLRLRLALQEELATLSATLRCTVLLVTHDFEEAAFLADRIVCMSTTGTITEIVRNPVPRARRTDRLTLEFREFVSRLLDQMPTSEWEHERVHPPTSG